MKHLKHYQSILNQSAYDYKISIKSPNSENENKSKIVQKLCKKHNLVQLAFIKERLQQHR